MAVDHVISAEWMRAYASERGGWNRQQVEALGLDWPPRTGWLKRLEGVTITAEKAAEFQTSRSDKAARLRAINPPEKSAERAYVERVKKATKKERRREKLARRAEARRAKKVASNVIPLAAVPRALPVPFDVTGDEFLRTYAWRQLRMRVLKHYGPRCMCCGATPADGVMMNIDHIKPRRLFPALALEFDNLQVLCGECNHGKGNWDRTDWRPDLTPKPQWMEDEEARAREFLRALAAEK